MYESPGGPRPLLPPLPTLMPLPIALLSEFLALNVFFYLKKKITEVTNSKRFTI